MPKESKSEKEKQGLFWGKIFATNFNLVIALCDKEIINKRLEYKDIKVKISKNFYGERVIDEETALSLMKRATIGNLIGKRIIKLAKKHDFITKENIISIGGIPHAQFVKI